MQEPTRTVRLTAALRTSAFAFPNVGATNFIRPSRGMPSPLPPGAATPQMGTRLASSCSLARTGRQATCLHNFRAFQYCGKADQMHFWMLEPCSNIDCILGSQEAVVH